MIMSESSMHVESLSENAKTVLRQLYWNEHNYLYHKWSVKSLAEHLGWGWHRTNNALKELGVK